MRYVILHTGVRGHRPRSTCPAWGASSLATGRTAGDLLRGSLANPTTVNSSTMKGPRGLAGESCGRRSRNAKDLGRWVRVRFYVRHSEIIGTLETEFRWKLCLFWRTRHTANVPPGKRDSDVIHKMKKMTNVGRSAAAGVVTGA